MAVAAFPSEADMLAPIARGLPRAMWPGRPKQICSTSSDVAAGVADIVAVEFDHRAVARRDFAGLDPSSRDSRSVCWWRSGPAPCQRRNWRRQLEFPSAICGEPCWPLWPRHRGSSNRETGRGRLRPASNAHPTGDCR